ncbi:MAG: class I SAM-dependent methyltransferase [Chitinophagaceae bacterium]
MSITAYIKKVVNFKFSFIQQSFGDRPFKLLDVGAGNHSASRIVSLFPNCDYYGLDMDKTYNNSDDDFKVMKDFYELDLTELNYSVVPNQHFDGIWMAHVIEHLYNGDKVLPGLLRKLKPGGYFYIEYPGKKSTTLPSMKGTLNFKDDATHVRVYSVQELTRIFEANGCTIVKSGTRRNWFYISSLPLRAMISLVKNGYVQGNVFWDLLGFAEYLWVKKN